jgi:hypothetical protein
MNPGHRSRRKVSLVFFWSKAEVKMIGTRLKEGMGLSVVVEFLRQITLSIKEQARLSRASPKI